jgi:hypothetical protein
MAGLTQLYDPEFLFRNNTFTSFVTTWLIRYVDPKKAHPTPIVEYVLDFRSLFFATHAAVPVYPFPRKCL